MDLVSEDSLTLSPDAIFQSDPTLGLRDLVLRVIDGLKMDKQVVILDGLKRKSSRLSLLHTIHKKIPKFKALCVKTLPKYGLQQALWDFHLTAMESEGTIFQTESKLKQWFAPNERDLDAKVEVPTEEEGFDVTEVKIPLTVKSDYKPDFPGLLLQWESLLDEEFNIRPSLVTLCQQWSKIYSYGRIIAVMCDKNNISRGSGVLTGSEDLCELRRCARDLTRQVKCPVYVLRGSTPSCMAPKPGLLACVHIRHLIGLQHKGTVYVFSSRDHMRMAAAAGIRYAPISSVTKSPELVLQGHGQTASMPPMLQNIQLVKSSQRKPSSQAQIPLYDLMMNEQESGYVKRKFHNGVEEYCFFEEWSRLERYQNSFASHLTPIDRPNGQPVDPESRTPSTVSASASASVIERRRKKSGDSSLTTPARVRDWMVKKPKKESSVDSVPSLKKEQTSSRCLRTVYVMSEKELTDMAKQVLRQAGQEIQNQSSDGDVT